MFEKERDIHHKHLHVFGFSRILWIGKLSKIAEKNSSAKIRVYWAEVDVDPANPAFDSCPVKPNAEIKSLDLPIGYLTLLHINAIFYKGHIVSPWSSGKLPFEQRTEKPINIDFSRTNLTFFNRHDKDEFQEQILHVKSNRLKEMKEAADSKCFGVRIGDDPYGIIFPCAEILRFFYCTSSTMANVLFDGRINNPGEHLYNASEGKSFGPIDDHVFITLRKGMLDSDARIIAALYSDPGMQNAAAEIAKAAAAQEGQYRDVIAYPPFDGIVQLEFFYVLVRMEGRTRKFVTRIIHSYHRPNFSTMEFDRDYRGEADPTGPTEGEMKTPELQEDEYGKDENQPELSDGTYMDPQFADDLRRAELGARFPEFAGVQCLKIPYHLKDPDGRRRRLKIVKTAFNGLTTAKGSGQDEKLRKLHIHSPPDFDSGSTESRHIAAEIGYSAYQRTVKCLQIANEKGLAEINFVKEVLPHFAVINGTYFNVYPAKSKSYFPRQTFQLIDKASMKARMVLVVQLRVGNKTRFLVDFQQKQEKELSYQVFWFESEVVPSNAKMKLKEALYSYAATKTSGGAYVNVIGLRWGSFKHKQEKVADNWIVEQVFNVKNK